jgi:phosphonate transport system permease protein
MTKQRLYQTSAIVLAAAIILLSFINLNYKDMAEFSLANVQNVLSGLAHPDLSYLYDGSGEDVISLMGLTLAIAFLGTTIATVLAVPFSFLSAHNLWGKAQGISKIGKALLNIMRAFPELVYAIIFVKMVGPGPFAGVLAIGLHQIGMLGKLYTEEIELSDHAPVEAVESVGGNFWQVLFYGRIPQLTPAFLSLALNHFEIAIRSAATLGLVGAGGIGAPMIFAIQAHSWGKVSVILLAIIVTVYVIDILTGMLRKKLQ